jgi:hypothetical protein
MAIDPDKIELKPRAPEVKEVATTPATRMAEAAESLINLVQKINDLADAKKAILRAKDLHSKGDTAKAKDLALGVFKRLQDIGKAPEGLDIQKVQELLTQGRHSDLAEAMRKVKDAGEAKSLKRPEELIDKLKTVKRDTPIDPREKDPSKVQQKKDLNEKNKKTAEEVMAEIGVEVEKERKVVDVEEEQIQKEFTQLLDLIETKASAAEKKELEEIKASIESRTVGEVDTREQIDKLKAKITDKVKDRMNGVSLTGAKDKAVTARGIVAGDTAGARRGLAERVKQSNVGERAFIVRLQKLTSGLDKVNEAVQKGVGLQEAVRSLDVNEIREIRTMIASIEEIKDIDQRSPYYDETYVGFIDGLGLDPEELAGIEKMFNVVDVHYKKAMLERDNVGPEITGQRVSAARTRYENQYGTPENFRDGGLIRDDEGNPVYGLQRGILSPEYAKALYESGYEHFNNAFEQLPDGSFREKRFEEQLGEALRREAENRQRMGLMRNQQRESFQNIDMQELFDYMAEYDAIHKDEPGYKSIREMIDDEFYYEHQVAKLKDEFLVPEPGSDNEKRKKEFEEWWYQEVSFEQRKLAYEGLFERRNQSPRMSRLNSLMEIIGVATTKKGLANWMAMSYNMIDQQNNSYVNSEFMQKLAGFWTNQGVDFRLEDMLKQYREDVSVTMEGGFRKEIVDVNGNKVTLNVFDTLNFMQEYVPEDAALRAKLGIPTWWKGKWGTYVYKYSAEDARGKARAGAWEYFLKEKKHVKLEGNENFTKAEQGEVSNKYQLMFDLAFNYAVSHKQLYQMLGNASFKEGAFELPAGCAEMHLKLDTVLYSKLFVPRYNWLNVAFKEGWALFDPGVRDYITMAPQDYASHFTQFSKDNPNAMETDNGSPTIIKTFFIGDANRSATADEIAAAEQLKKVFDKALWHHGKGRKRQEALDFMMEWGSDSPDDQNKSAYRNSTGVVSELLSNANIDNKYLDLINWDEYLKIAKDPEISRRIKAAKNGRERWAIFAETFGEHSYNHSTPSAKRSGDHPVKYGVEAFNKYVEAFTAWVVDPFNPEKFDALMTVPTQVNAAIVPGLAEKNLQFLMLMGTRMGHRYLGGGSMKRLARDPKNGLTKFNTGEGVFHGNESEWPAYAEEEIHNDKAPWNPIQHKSIPESVGIGVPLDKQVMFDLIRGQRAQGRLPDELYSELYKKINRSTLWEKELGVPINIYKWITLEPIFEAIAPMLGITAYELKKVLSENTSKTTSSFWKYLNS